MKFSIRDLLFVTVIIALAVAWWLDHRRLAAKVETAGPKMTEVSPGRYIGTFPDP